ncbi:alpha/beta hydrolase fold domain-containing protein [Glutamicibacter sp. TV12E]|uniref:alpha/beta hydrolase fold domain-containing protein n=1 Tax=Glutamicibacter sp. TV12E TaxID=3446362 RepID=UPI0040342F79
MTSSSSSYPVRSEAALEYPGGDGAAQLMDLYLPDAGGPLIPVVIWLHGGGWFTGDRTLAPDLAGTAARTGIAFASIEYRLSGEAKFPAPLDDVIAAIRHLRTQGEQWGIDGQRIGLWGASAGAHLAAVAALAASSGAPADAQVSCVAACYPPVDLELIIATQPAGTTWRQTPEGRLLGEEPGTDAGRKAAQAANPLTHVSENAPPFLLCHGTADALVPPVHSQMLFEALASHSTDARLYLLEGYRHGFANPPGRLDVQIAAVMDDGRLQAESSAAAVLRDTSDPEPRDTSFSFGRIEEFLAAHLRPCAPKPLAESGETAL